MSRDPRDARTLDLFAEVPAWATRQRSRNALMGLCAALDTMLELAGTLRPTRPVVAFPDFRIKRGRMTEAERDEILRLAEEEGLKPWRIGRILQRHPSTVTCYLYSVGLKTLSPVPKRPFERNGQMIWPFTDEEDEFIIERRTAGDTPAMIAKAMEGRFPHPRSRGTVAFRLMMLASDETARDAA